MPKLKKGEPTTIDQWRQEEGWAPGKSPGPKPRQRDGHGIDGAKIIAAMREQSDKPVAVDLQTGQVKSSEQMGVIAIDPGDVHCGMALGILTEQDGKREFDVVKAWESDPDECADYVASWLVSGELAALVVEKFNLYADKAEAQIGSEFPTVQLIGVLKYLVRVANLEAEKQGRLCASLAMYGADTKKSMRNQLRARGITLLPAEADHARDAQLHLWHYVGAEKMGWGQ